MKLELRDDLGELLEMVVSEAVKTYSEGQPADALGTFATRRLAELAQEIKAAREQPAILPGTVAPYNFIADPLRPTVIDRAGGNTVVIPPESKPTSKTIKSKPIIGKKYHGSGANLPKPRATPNWSEAEDKILLGYEAVTPKPWNDIVQHLQDAGFTLRNQSACEARMRRLLDRRADLAAREQAQKVRELAFTGSGNASVREGVATAPIVVDADGGGHPDILPEEWRPRSPTREELMGKVYGR